MPSQAAGLQRLELYQTFESTAVGRSQNHGAAGKRGFDRTNILLRVKS